MKLLSPIKIKSDYDDLIEKSIKSFFIELYKPINDITKKYMGGEELINSKLNLSDYIVKGTIRYSNGQFTGSFNSTITKQLKQIGASYNKTRKTWSLPKASLTADILQAIGTAESNFNEMKSSVANYLQNLNIDDKIEKFSITNKYNTVLQDLNKQFEVNSKYLTIIPEFTKEQSEAIAEAYNNNLKLYIKDFTDKNILKLRENIIKNVGMTTDVIAKEIKDSYNVSKNKAKFLAKQETSLLTAQFTKTRYTDVGVNRYKWSTSGDSRVREDHKRLNGKIFSFDQPPIVDEATGRRANPSEDFGCRCVAIGVIE